MTHTWDSAHYLSYGDERGRPFVELLARVGAESPATVVDLGCGAGNLTALLPQRWPGARVTGLDSSPEMIAAAPADTGIDFVVGDLREWATGDAAADVILSNAALQWVPGHLGLLPDLVGSLRPGGWLALQVPGNVAAPSHTIRRDLAAEAPYDAHTGSVATPASYGPETYLRVLGDLGSEVDAWETTYLHVLHGADAVFDWVSGTGARPTLQALPADLRADFEEEFRRRLREAYPERDGRVVLPFRRVFAVARPG